MHQTLTEFILSYRIILGKRNFPISDYLPLLKTVVREIAGQETTPYRFAPYHKKIRKPVDYYRLGIECIRPLVDLPRSTVSGLEVLHTIGNRLRGRENVILCANHQTEADPQAISLLLEKHAPRFAEDLIFVAGTRVTTDPFAVPFSMGRNLLCIHSKKYIDIPPEQKRRKQFENRRTMQIMRRLLSEGGHAIYIAPSGGRDRMNTEGEIEISPFDPQSIGMLQLMAEQAARPTRFHTLALSTYSLFPPPRDVRTDIGEKRVTLGGAIHLAFGPEVDMNGSRFARYTDRFAKRRAWALSLWRQVKDAYDLFGERR